MTKLVLLPILASCLYAQESLQFEAASIKARPVTETNFTAGGSPSGPHLRLVAMNLERLVWWAYQVDPWRITGGPSWKTNRYFDIEAKAEGDDVRPIGDFRVMLRSLLIERFHLTVHNETRESAVYALTIDKAGLKMRESAPATKS